MRRIGLRRVRLATRIVDRLVSSGRRRRGCGTRGRWRRCVVLPEAEEIAKEAAVLLALCRRLLLEFLHTGAQCGDLVLRVFHSELLDQNGLAKDVERVRVPTECIGEKAFSVRILGLELGAVNALDKSVEKLLLLLCHRFLLPFRRRDCPDGHTQWTRERTRSFVLFIVTPTVSWMFRRSPRQGAPSEGDYASKDQLPAHGLFVG